MNYLCTAGLLVLPALAAAPGADAPPRQTPRAALRAFNDLIGSWRALGEPYGTREQKQRGFWQERVAWRWQFRGDDAWLRADFEGGKYFRRAELHYLPARGLYALRLTTRDRQEHTWTGKLANKRLTLDRETGTGAERLVVSLLHANRYLYRYEVRPAGHVGFTPVYQVGATKEGVAFAGEDDGPECVVSGGLGTLPVRYQGRTYYVCCTGCRDAFLEDPGKYIKEYEARKKRKE